jgi:diguanylate cyclase (GGDEF)-like protein
MSRKGSLQTSKTVRHDHRGRDSALLFLARLASEFTAMYALTDLLERIMLALIEETGFASCSLALLDERHPDTLTVQSAEGLDAHLREHTLSRDKGLHGLVMASGMPLLVSDAWSDPRVHRRENKVRSGIYAPLVVDDRPVGVLSAHSPQPEAFTERDLSLLTIIARYITGAIEIARLHASLRDLAATDALTGLANRRAFLDRLASEVARSRRTERVVSVVVLDLDGFRIINDVHGHQTGDGLLVQVAQTLARSIRASDLVARLGSDEFGLLLPETTPSLALKLISRLKALTIAIHSQRQAGSPVGFSYGIAAWPKDAQTPEQLLREAEGRLHAMKQQARKRNPAKVAAREAAYSRR